MTYDPEQIRDERRELPRPERSDAPASPPPEPSKEARDTIALLARLRDGEQGFNGRRWLCIARSDRRPSSSFELARVLREIAKAEGVPLEVVCDSVDKALEGENSSLAAWSDQLDRPRPVLGRGLRRQPDQGVAC